MENYSKNENIGDVFMNEVRIEDQMLVEHEEMINLQIEGSRNLEMNENNLRKLYAQRTL
jgi:hypothetical protein